MPGTPASGIRSSPTRKPLIIAARELRYFRERLAPRAEQPKTIWATACCDQAMKREAFPLTPAQFSVKFDSLFCCLPRSKFSIILQKVGKGMPLCRDKKPAPGCAGMPACHGTVSRSAIFFLNRLLNQSGSLTRPGTGNGFVHSPSDEFLSEEFVAKPTRDRVVGTVAANEPQPIRF
jgi:hypothetical protein